MKKVSLWLLGASLIMLGACNPKPKKGAETEMAEEPMEEVDPPSEIISLDEAKALCENYENRRIPGIKAFEAENNESEGEFVPVQFVSFDFKAIKTYIKYIEQEAGRAKVQPDSLRIYLANYGKEGPETNRNTVFFVPAAQVGNEYGGFYIGDDGQAKLIRNYWPKNGENGGQEDEPKSKASFAPTLNFSLMQGGGSTAANRGHGGPPPTGDF